MAKYQSCVVIALIIHAGWLVIAEDVKDSTYYKVYYDITSFQGCFRRFNGTDEIGCSSGLRGNVGVLHHVENSSTLQWLLDNGPHAPYIAVLKSQMFTNPTLEKLLASGKINGLIVLATSFGSNLQEYPQEFTPDYSCPNPTSDISSCSMDYNSDAAGIMFRDIGMPWMVMLNDTEIQSLLSAISGNAPKPDGSPPSHPLAAAELKAFMHGAGNTPICTRRSSMQTNLSPDYFCDYLGGQSSIGMLGVTPRNETRNANSVVMVTARSDSFSLFQNMARGANSPFSSVVVLLAAVEALRPYSDVMHSAGKDVLFTLLTGESFDYIGSQKLVYDMKADDFPNITSKINLTNIDMVVELSDMLEVTQTKKLFSHIDPSAPHQQVQDFLNKLSPTASLENLNLMSATSTASLPPSSSQMFIREDKSNGFPVVVLAEYNTTFKNKYYHSLFDNQYSAATNNITEYNVTETAVVLADISTALASAILRYITNNDSATTQASESTTQALLYCLQVNPQCDLFYEVIGPDHVSSLDQQPGPLPSYVSVYNYNSVNSLQYILLQLMAYYSGTVLESAVKNNCTDRNDEYAYWMNGKLNIDGAREHQCVMASTQFINSTSPAQFIEGYDMTSGLYSTWTESVWPGDDPFHIKLFYVPSQQVTLATALSGVAMLIVSAVLVYLLDRNSDRLFPSLSLSAELVDYRADL